MILVTGATGNVGAEVLKILSASGQTVRAFVRNRSRIAALPGVDYVEGDFRNPATFAPALDGVDRLFLLIPSSAEVAQQQQSLVAAAKQSKIKHLVKLSQFAADEDAPGRFQLYHGAVEQHIRKSGMPFTFLRPNLFMQGLLNFRATISSQGVFYAPAGNAEVSVVDVRDIAAVAAKALTESGHEGKIYDITGPESLTHAEMAEQLSRALGKPVKYVDVPPEAMKQSLLSLGMPRWQAEGLVEDYDHYSTGDAAMVSWAVRQITGREAIRFRQFARDYAGRFLSRAAGAA